MRSRQKFDRCSTTMNDDDGGIDGNIGNDAIQYIAMRMARAVDAEQIDKMANEDRHTIKCNIFNNKQQNTGK